MKSVGRNDPCPCGSGRKYKKCCLPRDEALVRKDPDEQPATGLEEEPFTAELRPDVDKAVDRLLERLERGERQGLRAKFEALLREHPSYHMTNYAMGVYLATVEEDTDAATPFFEKAVRVFPPMAEAHYNLGNCHFRGARAPEAVASFRKAIRYSTDNDGIDALARERLRALEKIVKDSTPFATVDAYVESQKLFDEAFERLRDRQYAEAIELFKRVLEQNPQHVQSYGNMGLAYAGLGKKAAALECLDKALALDPTYGPALNNRVRVGQMKEGEPLNRGTFGETEYYRDQLEAEKSGKGSWWDRLKVWERR